MRKPFKQTFILKTGILILFLGFITLPFVWRLFPENKNVVTANGYAAYYPNIAEPGPEPEPSDQDSMTYGQFKKIEDRRQLIQSEHEYANQTGFAGFEIGPCGISSKYSCDTCRPDNDEAFAAAPLLYYLELPGYYLDPNLDCYSWNGKNFVSGPGHSEIKEAPFRYSYSNYANRYFDRKGTVMISISKKAYKLLYPVFCVLFFGCAIFLYYFYFSIPLKILIRISNGQVFTDRNIRQLKWLAWILVAPTFILLALKYMMAGLFHKELAAGVHVSFLSAFEFSAIPFIAALVVFGIIVAFRRGQKLQNDQDLTI